MHLVWATKRLRTQQAQSFVLTVDGVGAVEGGLVHGRVADEPRGAGERDAGRREEVVLVVGDDLASVVPPHGHAGVRRAQVDADRRAAVALHRRNLIRCDCARRGTGGGASTTAGDMCARVLRCLLPLVIGLGRLYTATVVISL